MNSYLLLKTVHLAGVVFFLGNIIVTGWWKTAADMTRDPRIIGFAQRQVTVTDWVFTVGGIVLILIGGLGAAGVGGLPLGTPWISLGLSLFIASGVIYAIILIPIQIKAARLARGFAAGGPIPPTYWRLQRWWMIFGILATVLPFANLVVMVFKFD